jgi:hypothetical protein
MSLPITIEKAESRDTGVCPCCGNLSRTVWGYAYSGDRCIAAYFVHWTLGRVRAHGANFDLIIGDWGAGTTNESRRAVALAYRVFDHGPEFMVIDARSRPFSQRSMAGEPLSRQAVIGTDVASKAFAIVDSILINDQRVAELSEALSGYSR